MPSLALNPLNLLDQKIEERWDVADVVMEKQMAGFRAAVTIMEHVKREVAIN